MADTNNTPLSTPQAHLDKKPAFIKRVARYALWFLIFSCLLLALLLGGAWWWSGQSDSLPRTLQLAQRFLPAGQTLSFSDAEGSLRQGGTIGQLHYANADISINATQTDVRWDLSKVLSRELSLPGIHIAQLTLTPSGIDKPQEPTQPLEQIPLPLAVLDVPFTIDEIVWAAPTPVTITALQGRYQYRSNQHQLGIGNVQAFNGRYQLQAKLDALAPMALNATLQAHIDQPASEQLPAMQANATASVRGPLAGIDASLHVQAEVKPQISTQPDAGKPSKQTSATTQALAEAAPMQAQVDATIYPWKPWPLGPSTVTLQSLNLASFLPQLPTSLLNGNISVTNANPDALAKAQAAHAAPTLAAPLPDTAPAPLPVPLAIHVALSNALPGPLDVQQLPISQVNVQAFFDGQQIDVLPGSAVHVGKGQLRAAGHNRLADQYAGLQASLQALNPSLIDTRIDSAPLSGTLQASTHDSAITFDSDIRSDSAVVGKNTKTPAFAIERIIAKGQWKAPVLQLSNAQIDALGAHISASQLTANTAQLSGAGQLSAQVPGATLVAQVQAAPTAGKGDLTLKLSNAEQLLQWLRRVPGAANALPPALSAQGSADASVRFNGGYGDALRQLHKAGVLAQLPSNISASNAQAFSINASVATPQLTVRTGTAPSEQWQLRDTQLTLNGNLAQLQADVRANARQGEQQFTAQLQATASSNAAQQWKTSITRLQASAQLPPHKTPWQAALLQPLDVQLTLPQAKQALQISANASQLQLSGPEAGTATVQWNPLTLTMAAGNTLQLQSSGNISGLPLRWARAFQKNNADSEANNDNLLNSDLVLQGRWDINTLQGLNAKLHVERASGDLRLLVHNNLPKNVIVHANPNSGRLAQMATAESEAITAGIRAADIDVTVQGRQVQASVRWDTRNAGQLTAQLQTSLQYEGSDFLHATLPSNAPLAGSIKAQMPSLGIWSNFAPPGWRVAGSLDADVQLAGNLQDPRWAGSLKADKMRMQSQLDGVDLRNGSLRARLNSQELTLESLRFEGGQGSTARIIGYSGNLTPAPTEGGTLDASGTIRWSIPTDGGAPNITMDIRSQAKALQVLVRADRQVSVSGDVRTQLQQGQLSISGDLQVDRASIMLANESAPKLGSDVVVHTQASRSAAAQKAQQAVAKATDAAITPAGGITPAKPMLLDIKLNLGRDFALQGYGITTRLRGALNVQNAGGSGLGMPRITGVINTEEGRYRAWGQVLNVDTGQIRFNGPYDNPSLDILALRPSIAVQAGAQISGSAKAPRVKLYSNPEMPDAEKLTWIITGRDPTAGGANNALMQQAAIALLSGGSGESLTNNIAKGIGLDEIGFSAGNGDEAGGLSLGKRLSKDLYVTYEASLGGALGALYVFYDFTRNLQLRGSAGIASAVDLIYTMRYD